jgi:hypothetical protein
MVGDDEQAGRRAKHKRRKLFLQKEANTSRRNDKLDTANSRCHESLLIKWARRPLAWMRRSLRPWYTRENGRYSDSFPPSFTLHENNTVNSQTQHAPKGRLAITQHTHTISVAFSDHVDTQHSPSFS